MADLIFSKGAPESYYLEAALTEEASLPRDDYETECRMISNDNIRYGADITTTDAKFHEIARQAVIDGVGDMLLAREPVTDMDIMSLADTNEIISQFDRHFQSLVLSAQFRVDPVEVQRQTGITPSEYMSETNQTDKEI